MPHPNSTPAKISKSQASPASRGASCSHSITAPCLDLDLDFTVTLVLTPHHAQMRVNADIIAIYMKFTRRSIVTRNCKPFRTSSMLASASSFLAHVTFFHNVLDCPSNARHQPHILATRGPPYYPFGKLQYLLEVYAARRRFGR